MNNLDKTDLACEIGMTDSVNSKNTRLSTRNVNGFEVLEMDILNERAELKFGRKIGKYFTICSKSPWMYDRNTQNQLSFAISVLIGELLPTGKNFLVVGLGNKLITADSLGPETMEHLTATRHLKEENTDVFNALGGYELSVITVGVEGQTGISAFEIVKSALKITESNCVIIVDALCARDIKWLSSTVQITNAGISPGSGVGNHKTELSYNSLNVPVISIGVPTVVSTSALIHSTLREAHINETNDFLNEITNTGKDFFVSPKDCDIVVSSMGKIIAKGITLALEKCHKAK